MCCIFIKSLKELKDLLTTEEVNINFLQTSIKSGGVELFVGECWRVSAGRDLTHGAWIGTSSRENVGTSSQAFTKLTLVIYSADSPSKTPWFGLLRMF